MFDLLLIALQLKRLPETGEGVRIDSSQPSMTSIDAGWVGRTPMRRLSATEIAEGEAGVA